MVAKSKTMAHLRHRSAEVDEWAHSDAGRRRLLESESIASKSIGHSLAQRAQIEREHLSRSGKRLHRFGHTTEDATEHTPAHFQASEANVAATSASDRSVAAMTAAASTADECQSAAAIAAGGTAGDGGRRNGNCGAVLRDHLLDHHHNDDVYHTNIGVGFGSSIETETTVDRCTAHTSTSRLLDVIRTRDLASGGTGVALSELILLLREGNLATPLAAHQAFHDVSCRSLICGVAGAERGAEHRAEHDRGLDQCWLRGALNQVCHACHACPLSRLPGSGHACVVRNGVRLP